MSETEQKRVSFLVFFWIFSLFFSLTGQAATFFGNLPTGLIELTDYKYPAFLYVPANYKPEKTYPLIITVPEEGEAPDKNIEFWLGIAKRKSMLVLAATNLWSEDTPDRIDKWFLGIKKDVSDRYHIAPEKIYLIGKGGGAHYVTYLMTRHPEEFSAAAAIDGSWVGKFEKLLEPQSAPRNQRPIYVALANDDPGFFEKTEKWAYRFEKKGYPVYLEKLKKGDEISSDEFKKKLLAWLEEKSQKWQQVIRENQKSMKEKIRSGVEDYVTLKNA